MISLIIAGGVSLAAASSSQTNVVWPDIDNHTLLGETIPSSQVVTRNMWGTPMLPDGKGGYSLIAPINQDFIAQSLIIPPWNIPASVTTEEVIFRPLPVSEEFVEVTDVQPAAVPIAPVTPAPAMDPSAPIEPVDGMPMQ